MELTIERLNGTRYRLSDYNISIAYFKIDSPSPRFEWENIENLDGLIDLGTTYAERKLSGSFEFVSEDYQDFPLLRNEIFKIFHSKEAFYLIDSREPGKRWLVKANGYSPDQLIANRGQFNIEFISPRPFAESVGSTLDSKTFDSQFWQTGQGLVLDETMYNHSTNTFQIYNASDGVTVDPCEMPLVIKFQGGSTNLEIKNLTTLDTWRYTGQTESIDIIELNGVRALKNGFSIFGTSNRKLITLKPGWNDFEIVGATDPFNISFDFRFYTL